MNNINATEQPPLDDKNSESRQIRAAFKHRKTYNEGTLGLPAPSSQQQSINSHHRRKFYNKVTKERKTKKEESNLNFKRWLLTLVSAANVLLAILIIIMGFKASQFNFNDLLVVDKALMALGVWVLLISIVNLYGLGKESDEIMLFVLYNCVISFILLSIFAIGAISFSDNLIDWIDKHWDEIRLNQIISIFNLNMFVVLFY